MKSAVFRAAVLAPAASSLFLLVAPAAFGQAEQPVPPPAAEPTPAAPPAPAPAFDPAALQQRLDEVDQRSRIADRKIELLEEEAAKKKAESPVLAAGEKGFNWKSADGGFVVKVRGLIHADGRQYLDDRELELQDTFLIRRARPLLEASFANLVDFRLMPDFGNGAAVVQDAYIDLRPFPWLKLRGGKFKPPVSLERLQSASAIVFPERAFPTSLAPNRDVGLQLHGLVLGGAISYELGVWNGVVDNGVGDRDNNHAKDFVGRLFLQPWKGDPYSPLANLGVGVAGSTGNQRGTPAAGTRAAAPALPTYRSAGQQDVFSYGSGVVARGRRTRISPQGYWYVGPFGLLAEFIQTRQRVERNLVGAKLTHRAWQTAGQWVFGGKPLFEGVTVTEPFDPAKGTWGALELAARYSQLDLDDDAFAAAPANWADATGSVTKAQAVGAAVSWHWSRNLKLTVAYERTAFEGGLKGATGVADRKTEQVLFQRIQAAF